MDDTSAVLIPDKWVSDDSSSDDSVDGEDIKMAEVPPVGQVEAKEAKEKSIKKKIKKKENNSVKGVILGEIEM